MMDGKQALGELYGVWHQPFWQRSLFKWGVAGVGILTLVLLAYALIRSYLLYRSRIARSPWEVALSRLDGLRKKTCTNKGEIQEFYVHLIDTLKGYLSYYCDDLMEAKSDEELIVHLSEDTRTKSFFKDLSDVVRSGSGVRFAGEVVTPKHCENHLNIVENFVKTTIPSEEKS